LPVDTLDIELWVRERNSRHGRYRVRDSYLSPAR
jgi:hypothetical protein